MILSQEKEIRKKVHIRDKIIQLEIINCHKIFFLELKQMN